MMRTFAKTYYHINLKLFICLLHLINSKLFVCLLNIWFRSRFLCAFYMFGSVRFRETELLLTCSVRFGQNGKTLLRSVTTIHRVKNAGNFPKVLKKPLCNDLANAKDQSISDQSIFFLCILIKIICKS